MVLIDEPRLQLGERPARLLRPRLQATIEDHRVVLGDEDREVFGIAARVAVGQDDLLRQLSPTVHHSASCFSVNRAARLRYTTARPSDSLTFPLAFTVAARTFSSSTIDVQIDRTFVAASCSACVHETASSAFG